MAGRSLLCSGSSLLPPDRPGLIPFQGCFKQPLLLAHLFFFGPPSFIGSLTAQKAKGPFYSSCLIKRKSPTTVIRFFFRSSHSRKRIIWLLFLFFGWPLPLVPGPHDNFFLPALIWRRELFLTPSPNGPFPVGGFFGLGLECHRIGDPLSFWLYHLSCWPSFRPFLLIFLSFFLDFSHVTTPFSRSGPPV